MRVVTIRSSAAGRLTRIVRKTKLSCDLDEGNAIGLRRDKAPVQCTLGAGNPSYAEHLNLFS